MELRNGFGQGFYDMIMMYACCGNVGQNWYDVVILKLDWYKHGKREKQAVIMSVLQEQFRLQIGFVLKHINYKTY